MIQRYFGKYEKYSIRMKIQDEGFHAETDLDTSFTKWEAVRKCLANPVAFALHLPSGNLYIPSNLLSDDQRLFIVSQVQKHIRAA